MYFLDAVEKFYLLHEEKSFTTSPMEVCTDSDVETAVT